MDDGNGTLRTDIEVGDAVYCLAAETTMIALGVVAPRTGPLDAGTLDGIDSSGFLQQPYTPGNQRIWWGYSGAITTSPARETFHPHLLAAIPTFVDALAGPGSLAYVTGASSVTSGMITLTWSAPSVNVSVYVVAIG